jgi:L-asparagine transporter-like permease
MWWFIIGFVVFFVMFGMIGSAVEQRRDEEFREQTAKQLGKLAEWWYDKKE